MLSGEGVGRGVRPSVDSHFVVKFYLNNKFYIGSLSSKEASVDVWEGRECHIMPSGDPFAEARIQFTVETDQIDFLASDCVANEKVEPLPLGITSQDYGLPHDGSRTADKVFV